MRIEINGNSSGRTAFVPSARQKSARDESICPNEATPSSPLVMLMKAKVSAFSPAIGEAKRTSSIHRKMSNSPKRVAVLELATSGENPCFDGRAVLESSVSSGRRASDRGERRSANQYAILIQRAFEDRGGQGASRASRASPPLRDAGHPDTRLRHRLAAGSGPRRRRRDRPRMPVRLRPRSRPPRACAAPTRGAWGTGGTKGFWISTVPAS